MDYANTLIISLKRTIEIVEGWKKEAMEVAQLVEKWRQFPWKLWERGIARFLYPHNIIAKYRGTGILCAKRRESAR